MVLELEDFSRESLNGFVENVPPAKNYPLASVFPDETTDDLRFALGIINGTYAKAASITGFNSSAPLRSHKQLEKVVGEITKLQHALYFDEETLLRFHNPRTDAERQRIIDAAFTDVGDLVQGVYDTKELLRAQVTYDSRIQYRDPTNKTGVDITFDRPVENTIDVAVAWSDKVNSTPLADLEVAVKRYKDANFQQSPDRLHITSAVESLLKGNEEIRRQVFGTNSAGARRLGSEDIQGAFADLGIPRYTIDDNFTVMEDEAGEDLVIKHLSDTKAVLFASQLGKTMIGPAKEKNFQTGIFSKPVIMEDPEAEKIIVGEATFPALQRPNSVVTLLIS